MNVSSRLSVYERQIDELRLRLGLAGAARAALVAAWIWGFAWGTLLLVLRLGGFGAAPWAVATAAVAALVGILGWRAYRSRPEALRVRALVDAHSACDGLLMAAAEAPLGSWDTRLPEPRALPRVRLKDGRSGALAFVALAYVLAATLVPVKPIGAASRLDIAADVARLAGDLEALKEEGVLEPEREESLKDALEALANESSGSDPARTWEALDHVSAGVKAAADQAAEKGLATATSLSDTEALASALAREGEELAKDARSTAMQGLAEKVDEARNDAKAASALPAEVAKAAREGTLSKEQLESLAAAASGAKKATLDSLKKLASRNLLDAKAVRRASQLDGAPQGKGLASFLDKNRNKEGVEGFCEANRPGKGGVSRGRGDAALAFDGETREQKERFKEKALPGAEARSIHDSAVVALSTAEPEAAKSSDPAASTLGNSSAAGTNVAPRVLPRHRETVSRYFERTE